MPTLFVSHSSANNAHALALSRWLEEQGWTDHFLDISPDRGLTAGERWQIALKAAADRCEAVLFLVSPAWLESRWCLAEFLLAKQLGKAVFGVVIESTPIASIPPEMTSEWQLADLATGDARREYRVALDPIVPETTVSLAEAGLVRLRRGLQQSGLDPSTFPWPPPDDPKRAPYRGLKALEPKDAAVFFGREAAVIRGLDTLRTLRARGPERMMVVLGSSGAGKSSFMRAGLLPRLARDDRHFFPLPVIRPERAAISGPTGLLASLTGAFEELGVPMSRADLRTRLAADGLASILAALHGHVAGRVVAELDSPALVLVVDQGEELFGAEGRAEADEFLRLLCGVLAPPTDTAPATQRWRPLAILSIRSDSYPHLQTEAMLARVPTCLFSLTPVPQSEFKTIIEGPAARSTAAGRPLRCDPRLTERLLEDAEGADAMPLLAFTLERLLLEHGGDDELSLADYEDLGGVSGSIEAAITAAFVDPRRDPVVPDDPVARDRLLRAAFVPWLARVDPDTEERKRRVARWDEIPPDARPLIERLVEQRLLVKDRRRVARGEGETIVVEVAHEALLRRWRTLTAWLDEDADALKVLDVAKRAADDWKRNDRGEAWLSHTGRRLRAVEVYLARPDLDQFLGTEGRAYIRACRARDDAVATAEAARQAEEKAAAEARAAAEQAAERERLKSAQLEREKAEDRASAARRITRRTTAGAAVIVSILAVGFYLVRDRQRAAESALAASDVMEASRRTQAGEAGHALAYLARAVRANPRDDGARAALVGNLLDHRWIVDVGDYAHREPTRLARLSPDGHTLLTAGGDEARLWDVASGQQIGMTIRHRNIVSDARFSPTGDRVVTGSYDRTARVSDARSGLQIGGVLTHGGRVRSVEFLPDGRRFLTRTSTAVRVARADDGTLLVGPLPLERDEAESVATAIESPDGRRLLTLAAPDVLRLWNLETGQPVGRKLRGRVSPSARPFSDDSRRLLLQRGDDAVLVDAESGTPIGPAIPASMGAGFFRDADHVLAATESEIALLDVGSGERSSMRLPGRARLRNMWLSDDGTRVTLLSWVPYDLVLTAFVLPEGREVARQTFPSETAVTPCAGTTRVAFTVGTGVFLWHGSAGSFVGGKLDHPADVTSATWSADCTRLATVAGSEARLWDAETGAPVGEPMSHDADVANVEFGRENRVLLAVTPNGARVWDLRTGLAATEPVCHGDRRPRDEVTAWFSGDGRVMATSSGRYLSLWNAATGERLHDEIRAEGDVAAVVFARGAGRMLVQTWNDTSQEPQWRVWDIDAGRPFDAIRPVGWEAMLSPDGQVVADGLTLWNADSATRRGVRLRHRETPNAIAFSDDSRLVATASSDQTARVWHADTGQPQGEPMRHDGAVTAVSFDRDGARVVTTADKVIDADGGTEPRMVRVWDATTGEPIGDPIVHDQAVTGAALSPDGSRVVTSYGRTVRIWDAATAAPIGEPLPHEERVTSIAWSRDGTRIATAAGPTIRLWDAQRTMPIGAPIVHGAAVTSVAFTAGESRLFSTLEEHQARFWDVPQTTAGDAPLLADLAEAIGGYRVSPLGALQPLGDSAARVRALRQDTNPGNGATTADAPARVVARWLLADPTQRTISPLATAKVGTRLPRPPAEGGEGRTPVAARDLACPEEAAVSPTASNAIGTAR